MSDITDITDAFEEVGIGGMLFDTLDIYSTRRLELRIKEIRKEVSNINSDAEIEHIEDLLDEVEECHKKVIDNINGQHQLRKETEFIPPETPKWQYDSNTSNNNEK